jgi:DivIVA domain-containing protein
MPEERLVSITTSLHLAPDDVARHSFGSVRRGFDPGEVRAYLESVAAGLRGVAERERELLDQLADAEHRAAHPVLDESTLTAALGSETARVLHSAHEVAGEIVAKAEAEANRLLTEAGEEIEQNRALTEARLEERTADVERTVTELRQRTDHDVAAALEKARLDAEEMVASAREQCRSMVEEAQGLRARVLADLAKRRKVLHAQIEQLRAGRERLAETVNDVRRSIDVIADDLFAAEDNARLAAEAAGREAAARPDGETPEELAATLMADEAAEAELAGDGTDSEAIIEVTVEEGVGGDPDPDIEESATGDGTADTAGGGPGESGSADADEPSGAASDAPEVAEESVDALFAKLRAARTGSGDPAPDPEPPAATAVAEDSPAEAPDDPESASAPEPSVEASTATPTVNEDRAVAAEDEGDEPPEERHPLVVQRDGLIDPLVPILSRRLKRTLQDSQNELLDRLRSNGSRWSADLLPPEVEHVDSYATAAMPALEQAAEAGVAFAGTGRTGGPGGDVLAGIAHQLADSVVGPLRRRLGEDEGLADAEESVVAEHVSSAFREWKGPRIERLAGDHVVAAFSAGSIAAADGKRTKIEWIAVSSGDNPPCPDCEDNGLNGRQKPGEEFPTSHRYPPAHPGCRCLVAISAT